jgi:hypothetical protein
MSLSNAFYCLRIEYGGIEKVKPQFLRIKVHTVLHILVSYLKET